MSRVGKHELASIVAERTDLPESTTQRVITEVFAAITDELAKGNSVALRGFGTWHTKILSPRKGRDPRLGTPLAIGARTRVGFKPGNDLRASVESTIEAEIFLGGGVARGTAIDSVLNNVLDQDASDLILSEVRRSIRSLLGPAAEREAHDFFSALESGKAVPEPVAEPDAVAAPDPQLQS